MIKGKPMFVEFKAQTDVSWIDPSDVKMPEYEKFEDFVIKKNDAAPEGLNTIR